MKIRDIHQFLVGFAVGLLPGIAVGIYYSPAEATEAAIIEPAAVVACDVTSDDETGEIPRDVLHVPDYCESFPERCHVKEPCGRKTLDDGSIVSACEPVDSYVCCEPGTGCWAVTWASACVDGFLYWSTCDAGESAIDPVSGEAIITCHD